MSRPGFVYVTYIASPLETVWNALTDGGMTMQYWHHLNVSDWKQGSPWKHQRLDDAKTVDIVGTVLENSHPHRLVLTWASPSEPDSLSRVTFEVEPYEGTMVRLTVIHDQLEPDSRMEQAISGGWPKVLSSLKTLLETGAALPMPSKKNQEKK